MAANNSNLLDEFCSSSLSPALLQSLLQKLLSHPTIFNGFNSILKLPSVQTTLGKLEDSKRAVLVKTVELFAYGSIKEYFELKEKEEVWSLTATQLEKLRMLSVVSIARRQIDRATGKGNIEMTIDNTHKTKLTKKKKKKSKKDRGMLSIPYSRLASELQIPDNGEKYDEMTHMRQVEDLLIRCIYSNVIAAKLDQSSKSLKIEPHVALVHEQLSGGGGISSNKDNLSVEVFGSVLSRDLDTSTPQSTHVEVSRIISSLQQFLKQSNSLLTKLENASKTTSVDRKNDELRWKEVQKVIEDSKLRDASSAGGGGGMAMGMGMMGIGGDNHQQAEVVDMAGRRQVKRSKGGHSMMMGGGGVRFG